MALMSRIVTMLRRCLAPRLCIGKRGGHDAVLATEHRGRLRDRRALLDVADARHATSTSSGTGTGTGTRSTTHASAHACSPCA